MNQTPSDPIWRVLTQVFSLMLQHLDDFIIFQTHTSQHRGYGPYVQIAHHESGCIVIEAVSNHYLEPKMDEKSIQTLVAMGWMPPDVPNGETNFFRHISYEEFSSDKTAEFFVTTLQQAYQINEDDTIEIEPIEVFQEVFALTYGRSIDGRFTPRELYQLVISQTGRQDH